MDEPHMPGCGSLCAKLFVTIYTDIDLPQLNDLHSEYHQATIQRPQARAKTPMMNPSTRPISKITAPRLSLDCR